MWSLKDLLSKKTPTLSRLRERYASLPKKYEVPKKAPLSSALRRNYPCAVIAEVKMASPSKGDLTSMDPIRLAKEYISAGAAALSVITEPYYFKGDIRYLREISTFSPIPVFRKDFILDPVELVESKVNGADAVLLIAGLFDSNTLKEMLKHSQRLGLEALVEVRDQKELDMALNAGADLIGINNRDLRDLSLDLGTTLRIAPNVPDHVLLVSESGIGSKEDILRLNEAGVYAFLVGTSLVEARQPGKRLREIHSPLKGLLLEPGPHVKFCGIMTREDAREAFIAGCDMIGLVFIKGKRKVSLEDIQVLTSDLPEGFPKIGVVDTQGLRDWRSYAREGIVAFQVHNTPAQAISRLKRPMIIPSIACPAQAPISLAAGLKDMPIIHIDGGVIGGRGTTADWHAARRLALEQKGTRIVLAGGLNPQNVNQAVETVRPWAVDVSSGIESSKGKKDREKMRLFVKNAIYGLPKGKNTHESPR